MVVFRRSRRAKSYIVKQEVRIKSLDSDKRSKVRSEIRFKVRSEVRIKEFLGLWLGAGIEKQTIDKLKRKCHSMLDSF